MKLYSAKIIPAFNFLLQAPILRNILKIAPYIRVLGITSIEHLKTTPNDVIESLRNVKELLISSDLFDMLVTNWWLLFFSLKHFL